MRRAKRADAGYIMLELVATLALAGLLMALVFPALPQGTGQSQFRALAVSVANLLRDARTEAVRRGHDVEALFDRRRRTISLGNRVIAVPPDIDIGLLAGARCDGDGSRLAIVFRGDGTNCGGVVRFALNARAARVRVNWLTGHVEILQDKP